MPAPAVKIRNLHKSFGTAQVLKGVDLDILPARINFIIGQSGGGKSVLLKHLVGLMAPDEGQIWYDQLEMTGRGSKNWRLIRHRMALLFQSGALFDSMSVGENVSFPLWVNGRSTQAQATQKAKNLLAELELDQAFFSRPSDLSEGEKKRAALARALIVEPEILFFDEPTTGLDPLLSAQVDQLISQAQTKTKATVVVVSHDIPATLSLAHNIAMIHDGHIILSGPPESFRGNEDPVIKQFISGSAEGPIDFLD